MTTVHRATLVVLSFHFITAVGCVSTQQVRRSEHGGEIALRGGYVPSMSEAHVIMAEHCGGEFNVLSEDTERLSGEPMTEGDDRVVYECARPGLAMR